MLVHIPSSDIHSYTWQLHNFVVGVSDYNLTNELRFCGENAKRMENAY